MCDVWSLQASRWSPDFPLSTYRRLLLEPRTAELRTEAGITIPFTRHWQEEGNGLDESTASSPTTSCFWKTTISSAFWETSYERHVFRGINFLITYTLLGPCVLSVVVSLIRKYILKTITRQMEILEDSRLKEFFIRFIITIENCFYRETEAISSAGSKLKLSHMEIGIAK